MLFETVANENDLHYEFKSAVATSRHSA
jgi:hypothetical protein